MSKGGVDGVGDAVTTMAGRPIAAPFGEGKEGGACASWAAAEVEPKQTNSTNATHLPAADFGISKGSVLLTLVKATGRAEELSAPDSG
jgi:hypothetical protein